MKPVAFRPTRPLRGKVDDLRLAFDWLMRLHRDHVVHTDVWTDQRLDDVVVSPVRDFERRFALTAEARRVTR